MQEKIRVFRRDVVRYHDGSDFENDKARKIVDSSIEDREEEDSESDDHDEDLFTALFRGLFHRETSQSCKNQSICISEYFCPNPKS